MNRPNLFEMKRFGPFGALTRIFRGGVGISRRDLHTPRKTVLFAIMYGKTREIRIVADPHFIDPSWEGVGGYADIYAQRYIRTISEMGI